MKVGLATSGPGPGDGQPPYPEVDPTIPDYRKPALYRLLRPVGNVDRQLDEALDSLRTQNVKQDATHPEVLEGQLVSLRELIAGEGVREQGSPDAAPRFNVPPGQVAGFRQQLGIRRLVIHATDEPFNNPAGTPRKRDGSPDIEGVAALPAERRVQQAAISPVAGGDDALADLQKMARLTGALVPEGGLDCGDGLVLEAGDPLVCEATSSFSRVITDLVRDLVDEQDAGVITATRKPVLGSVDTAALRGINVTQRNELPLRVRVSCVDVAPGSYVQELTATLRGFPVAEATARVTCTPVPVQAAAAPRPDPPAAPEPAPPAGQPAAQAPAPPAPAPPVIQPQTQPQAQAQTQPQAQVQPLTAAALQQQEQLQLALALMADEAATPRNEMAMVDRRRSEELRALALLSLSMAAASGLGLARLRTRRSDAVRVHRVR